MSGAVLRAIEPVDVVHLRGNRLFEGAGDGVAVMPPWPSLFAGAVRSRMLAEAGAVHAYAHGEGEVSGSLLQALGPSHARRGEGQLRVAFAGFEAGSGSQARFCMPAPADLVCFGVTDGPAPRPARVERLRPGDLRARTGGLVAVGPREAGAAALPDAPLLRADARGKPSRGWLLDSEGIAAWQAGETPKPECFVHASTLWADDPRLGIALDAHTRTVRTGLLYTSRAVALRPGVRFCVGFHGADDAQVPREGLLRLGGDGRGAAISPAASAEAVSAVAGRVPTRDSFVVWLVTPGAFPRGWRLPGLGDDGAWSPVPGFVARLRSAVMGRFEVVSGWSLADGERGAPKPAVRVVPAGSVYWFRRECGDFESLRPLLAEGLGGVAMGEPDSDDSAVRPVGDRTSMWRSRAQEGFGSVWFGDTED
jgi:CRISPR-associated protein Cmr3